MRSLAERLSTGAETFIRCGVGRVSPAGDAHSSDPEDLSSLLREGVRHLLDALAAGDDRLRHRPLADAHPSLDLALVVRAYGALRDVVLEAVEAVEEDTVPVTMAELRVFEDFFADAVAERVTAYATSSSSARATSSEGRVLARGRVEALAEKLGESEERLRRALSQVTEVLESMGDAFFALDAQFRVTLVNRQYERASKKSRKETLGGVFWELFPEAKNPASKYFQGYQRCMTERVDVQFVDFYAPLDLWTDVRAYPTDDGGIAVFFRDVSSERRAEEALRRQAEFEQQLIGIVSHDLQNPLNVVTLSSAMLTRREELSARAAPLVARIQSAGLRATRMVTDLLDFTRARLGGGIGITRRPADLHALVRAVMEEIEATYPGRQMDVVQEGDGSGEWDPDRIAQVVQNLVTNALKYSPAGSRVEVTTGADPERVSLRVRNAGEPIPKETLPTLFEPFQRGEGEAESGGRSVGLGLYIVRMIVEAHRGTVSATSEEGGTTFAVTLPRYAPRDALTGPGASV